MLDIKIYKQKTHYTCGCATLQMVLEYFNMSVPSEEEKISLLGTKPEEGTAYESLVNGAKSLGLQCQFGENGDFDKLNEYIEDGWLPIIAYSLDAPHYSVFLGHNGNHIRLADPFSGQNQHYLIKKFIRNQWKVDEKDYKQIIQEFGLSFSYNINTVKWWAIFKKMNK
jgi:predicted double-glycine peptidase